MIPQRVELRGTVRAMDPAVQDFVETRIGEIATGTAAALGATAELHYHRGCPVTLNAPGNARHAAEVARAISGQGPAEATPSMGGEDFSFMLRARPGAFIFLGNGDTAEWHSPHYEFDENAIPFGASWFAGMIEARMPAA